MHCFTQHTPKEEDTLGGFKSRHFLQAGLVYLSATHLEHLKDWWWGSFTLKKCVEHHGHFLYNGLACKDGEGLCYYANDCRFAFGMTCPGKLHHFLMHGVPGNIYDYITLVVTLWDFLISLQRISFESRNSLFCFLGRGKMFRIYVKSFIWLWNLDWGSQAAWESCSLISR